MKFGTTLRRNQRIGGLLNPIMEEPVASLAGDSGAGADRVAKTCMHRIVGFAAQLCQGRKVSVTAEAGEQLQRFLGLRSKTPQPADHQVHRIVAEPLVDDSVQIPCPRPRKRIELDHPFFGEAGEKLSGEKGIAAAASRVHQLSEWPHVVW